MTCDTPATFQPWSDRTRRAYDAIHLHYAANANDRAIGGHWVAIRLSDGGSDGNLYPSKLAAKRFQLHPTQCAYICLPPFDFEVTHKELDRYLQINEQLYGAGMDLSDAGTHVVPEGIF